MILKSPLHEQRGKSSLVRTKETKRGYMVVAWVQVYVGYWIMTSTYMSELIL